MIRLPLIEYEIGATSVRSVTCHIGSYRKNIWCSCACHNALPICQVWTKSVQMCLSYGSKTRKITTKWPPGSHIESHHKKNWRPYLCHNIFFLPSLNKIGSGICLNFVSKTGKITTKQLSGGFTWSFCKINKCANVWRSALPLCVVWTKSVHKYLTNGCSWEWYTNRWTGTNQPSWH